MLTDTQDTPPMPATDTAFRPSELPKPVTSSAKEARDINEPTGKKPKVLEEILIEEVSIDGMCGVY